MTRFAECHAVTARWEKGKVDHPRDPGGRTNNGVTQATYDRFRTERDLPRRDVYLMDPAEEALIFFAGYWEAARCYNLPIGLDMTTYDAAVNSGQKRSVTWLQGAVGSKPDGRMGVDTISRSQAAMKTLTAGVSVIEKAMENRTGFLRGLRTFDVFGKGWMNRCADVEANAVKAHANRFGRASDTLRDAAERASVGAREKDIKTTAVGGGAGSVTAIGWDGLPTSLIVAIIVVGLAGAFVMNLKARRDKARARAFLKET